jgi:hypothetical protein
MNRSWKSICYLGQCELINQSSCLKLDRYLSWGDVRHDENGCYSSRELRDTMEYRDYTQVGIYKYVSDSHIRICKKKMRIP